MGIGHKIIFALIPLILSIGIAPALSFAENEPYVLSHFSTKGKITENNPFRNLVLWTLISGDQGTIVISSQNGIIVFRLDVKQSDSCPELVNTVCIDSTITSVKNSQFGFVQVGDQANMVFEMPNKQTITMQSGNLESLVVEIDISKTWVKDVEEIIKEIIEDDKIDSLKREASSKLYDALELTKDSVIQKALKDSNEEFAALDDPFALIDERNNEWILAEDDEITPFMETILENKASEFLQKIMNEDKMKPTDFVYNEIILTNAYGANIAQTGKTTDYEQWDETWWVVAKLEGVSIVSGFDESIDAESLDMSVRIFDDDGRFLGVMKFVINVEKLF